MLPHRIAWLFVLIPVAAYGILFIGPLGLMAYESFNLSVPGRVTASGVLTFANYKNLLSAGYVRYLADTFYLSLIAALVALFVSYPAAYLIANTANTLLRKSIIAALICYLFTSALVKVYSMVLFFGPVGFQSVLTTALSVSPNSRLWAQVVVAVGLFQAVLPIAILTLIGTLQNIPRSLGEAALSLGATRLEKHVKVIVPLAVPGLVSAFLLLFAMSISSFITPLVLGRGQVFFLTNLIYSRFSEVADFPSGAAIGVTVLAISLFVVFGVTHVLTYLLSPRAVRATP